MLGDRGHLTAVSYGLNLIGREGVVIDAQVVYVTDEERIGYELTTAYIIALRMEVGWAQGD